MANGIEARSLERGVNGSSIIIDREKLLRRDTGTKGVYEAALKNVLLKIGIDIGISSYYEPVRLVLPGREDPYIPDFLVDIEIRGRLVLLEPHPSKTRPHWKRRIRKARDLYGDYFYFIQVGRYTGSRSFVRLAEDQTIKTVDELWTLPMIRPDNWTSTERGPDRFRGVKIGDQSFLISSSEWESIATTHIEDLVRRAKRQ